VIEELQSLTAGPGRVVVEVKACGVNFPDVLIIEDKYQVRPERPFSPGGEISGIVKAVGEGVTAVKPGDRVLATTGFGGMAQEIALEAGQLMKIPEAMSFDEAAALVMTFGTSDHALRDRGRLQAGETLLVLGAAGGVGLAAVALGKAMGARVVAACSTQAKVDLAMEHGADGGLVYPSGAIDGAGQRALSGAFKAACGPDGPDVIYDAVGGVYAEPAFRSIAWEGRDLVVGFAAGDIPRIPLNLPLLKGAAIVGVFWGAWTTREPEAFARSVARLMELHSEGRIKPHISARFTLDQAAAAIAHLRDRKALGKVVVVID
jgi:NADPH2:quinone reductase